MQFTVNSERMKSRFFRGAVGQNVKFFHVREFGVGDGFVDELAKSYPSLPFDYYDVARQAEALVYKGAPNIHEESLKEWGAFWQDLYRQEEPIAAICAFWEGHLKDHAILDTMRKLRPFRRRSCFNYELTPLYDSLGRFTFNWQLAETGISVFTQKVNDARARPRLFSAPPLSVYRSPDMRQLMCNLATYILANPMVSAQPCTAIKTTMHQMLTYAGHNPAPEGVHQDGADFIVSAIVIDKKNCIGGESRIYSGKPQELQYVDNSEDKLLIAKYTLSIGEGAFQADTLTGYWHEVTPIKLVDSSQEAYRAMLGFDFHLIINSPQMPSITKLYSLT